MSGKIDVFHLLRTSDRNGVKMPCSAEYAHCSRIRPSVVMKLLGLAETTACMGIKSLSSEKSAIMLHFVLDATISGLYLLLLLLCGLL